MTSPPLAASGASLCVSACSPAMLPDESIGQRILRACREGASEPLDVVLRESISQLHQETEFSSLGLRCWRTLWMVYNSLAVADLPAKLLTQHLWQALTLYLRQLEMGRADAECCEHLLAAAGAVHGKWARALSDAGVLALQETMQDTLPEWLNASKEEAVDFLSAWEAERLRREAGVIGKDAEIRSKSVDGDDVAETEGLDPDCFRLEARGCPASADATLHPPIPARNCRAGRMFGSDRFLMLRMGRLRAPEQFSFLGRSWRFLYWKVPDQITYFAEKGFGLEDCTVKAVWDELVPLEANQDMTLCKFNQRLQLSFSETRADICLAVREEDDLWDSQGRFCLSDGCGCISPRAAEAVAAKLGFDEVPCAFQARCGPWKGLWVLDPQLPPGAGLIVRPSQKKYCLLSDTQLEDISFEVLNTSTRHLHCCLTANSIQALESLGVSQETFSKLQQEVLEAMAPLLQADQGAGYVALEQLLNAQVIKAGLQKPLQAFIDLKVPWQEPNFVDLRFRVCTDLRRRATEDLRLPLLRGLRCWIVPDHTLGLRAGECFIQAPHRSGAPSLLGKEVVLIRSPCYHNSAVLKLRVPDEIPPGLSHIVNVVVLNACSLRQQPADAEVMGGDHDGDQVLVIWDEEIVDQVSPSSAHVEDASVEERDQKTLKQVSMEELPSLMLDEQVLAAQSHKAFREADNKRRDWVDEEGFDGENSVRLAAICQVGVDCASNGRTIEIPAELRKSTRPDWSCKKMQRNNMRISEKACGLLFRRKVEFPSFEEVQFLAPCQFGLLNQPADQLDQAVGLVLSKLRDLQEKTERIHHRAHLCRQWRNDLRKALFRQSRKELEEDFAEGVFGAAVYLVQLVGRAKGAAEAKEEVQKPKAQAAKEALESFVAALSARPSGLGEELRELLQSSKGRSSPVLRTSEIWQLFGDEVLQTLSAVLHGPCPYRPEESFLIDPTEVRFSHPAISPQFRSGLRLKEAVEQLLQGARKRDFGKIGPLPVRWHRGHFHTMGNRRLAVYRLFKFHLPPDSDRCPLIRARRVNEAEALRWPWNRKFEIDETEGRRVRVRDFDQVIGETANIEETTFSI
ncbi:RDR1 [Symbiodinium natans]|uniref:RNA-dependent RNA polymerase n=1 Tax=Symbiodinium natans TaxID=878477 RepID=A0A812IJG0_9DINO|nr:RDR1 [Symbiodinium natans]